MKIRHKIENMLIMCDKVVIYYTWEE